MTTTTATVKVMYSLNDEGRKQAVIAGRPATAEVVEYMEIDRAQLPGLMDVISVKDDGSLELAVRTSVFYAGTDTDKLSAPPAGVLDAARVLRELKAAEAAEQEARQKRIEQERIEREAKQQAQDQLVRELLDQWEQLGPLDKLPAGYRLSSTSVDLRGGGTVWPTAQDVRDRMRGLCERREAAVAAAKAAEKARIEAERDAEIAEHGGFVFAAPGGMCDFTGRNLWNKGQTRRWVGIFSNAKGIDTFLDGPRKEHTWDVRSLTPGDCIQGGGYDTNSRGRRRDETEFFGVVVRVDTDQIVVRVVDSRAEALTIARKEFGR
jgi:hypothetical protein